MKQNVTKWSIFGVLGILLVIKFYYSIIGNMESFATNYSISDIQQNPFKLISLFWFKNLFVEPLLIFMSFTVLFYRTRTGWTMFILYPYVMIWKSIINYSNSGISDSIYIKYFFPLAILLLMNTESIFKHFRTTDSKVRMTNMNATPVFVALFLNILFLGILILIKEIT